MADIEPVTRRDWLRRALLFSGATVAAEVVNAGSAHATDGNALTAGNQATAEHTTVLLADGGTYTDGLFHVTDTAFVSEVSGFPVAAVTGYAANSSSGTTGVAGFGTTTGVYGRTDSETGTAVFGDAHGSGGFGVRGVSPNWGVYGQSNSTGYGVAGEGAGGADGVHGFGGDSGNGVGGATSAATAAGVRGDHTATGAGIIGTSVGGRGGVFRTGGAAQVQLIPTSKATHPTGGKRGDLYADASGRLWYCKHGGTTATWHQIA